MSEAEAEVDRAVGELQSAIKDPRGLSFDDDSPLQRAIQALVSTVRGRTYARAYRAGWNDALETMRTEMGHRKKL